MGSTIRGSDNFDSSIFGGMPDPVRQANTPYTTGDKPRMVHITLNAPGPGTRILTAGTRQITRQLPSSGAGTIAFDILIPPNTTYSFNGSFSQWLETE